MRTLVTVALVLACIPIASATSEHVDATEWDFHSACQGNVSNGTSNGTGESWSDCDWVNEVVDVAVSEDDVGTLVAASDGSQGSTQTNSSWHDGQSWTTQDSQSTSGTSVETLATGRIDIMRQDCTGVYRSWSDGTPNGGQYDTTSTCDTTTAYGLDAGVASAGFSWQKHQADHTWCDADGCGSTGSSERSQVLFLDALGIHEQVSHEDSYPQQLDALP